MRFHFVAGFIGRRYRNNPHAELRTEIQYFISTTDVNMLVATVRYFVLRLRRVEECRYWRFPHLNNVHLLHCTLGNYESVRI